jgi:hypothetical protein
MEVFHDHGSSFSPGKNAEADRVLFRNFSEFRAIDLGNNWLFFVLPSAEMAVHPGYEGRLCSQA